jgi:hypothetical protein
MAYNGISHTKAGIEHTWQEKLVINPSSFYPWLVLIRMNSLTLGCQSTLVQQDQEWQEKIFQRIQVWIKGMGQYKGFEYCSEGILPPFLLSTTFLILTHNQCYSFCL